MGVTSTGTTEARVTVVKTGSTLVSPAVPNRASRRLPFAYTGLFQRRSRRIEVPVKVFLVEVGGHRVLVDTGWSEQCVTQPLRHMGFSLWFASEPVVAAGEGMGPQLKRLGLTPQELDAVVLTHMDCDHASGLVDLAGAPCVLASAEELAAAERCDVRYRPSFWAGISIEPVAFSPADDAPFGKACDLFGDGTIRLVFTPGHTAGSLVVVARNPASGRFALLAGDTGYKASSWDELRLPGPLVDADEMHRGLAWVRDMRAREDCVAALAAHDPNPALQGGTVLSF